MSRPLTFQAKTTAIDFAPHVVLRVTPTLHAVGSLPPVPPAGYILTIDTPTGRVNAEVLMSSREHMVFEAKGKRLGASPLRPTEIDMTASYPQDSGATDWVIRAEG